MKKPKLLSIGNDGPFNYIIISKEDDFFDWLIELLDYYIKKDSSLKYEIKYMDNEMPVEKNIKAIEDHHETFRLKSLRIDIFYGDKKIFITFITNSKNRAIINNKLAKIITELK